jgi:hypothetical protein
MRLLTLATVFALAAAPTFAATERGGMRGMMPAFDFEAADTDGDGTLTRAEFTAHVEAQIEAARTAHFERRAAAIMEAGDADGDGMLTLEELQQALATVHAQQMERRGEWRERHAERRAERAERRSERGDRAQRGPRGMHHGMHRGGDRAQMIDRMFDRIDADNSGTISAEEFAAAQARWQERAERRGQRRAD